MKHSLTKIINGTTRTIEVIERSYEVDFEPLEIKITNIHESKEHVDSASSFQFYDKKELHSFIGLLLHIQSKMK